ncbi:hypothetical protein AB3S75_015695 [Citrus x aurantiifolia]
MSVCCCLGTRHTRSQVGPDWSSKEALILVNEIAVVEADCLKALSSYQKWKIISETCTALDVPQTANQCRRKWDSLVDEYKKIIVRSRTFPNSQTQTHLIAFHPILTVSSLKPFVISLCLRITDLMILTQIQIPILKLTSPKQFHNHNWVTFNFSLLSWTGRTSHPPL